LSNEEGSTEELFAYFGSFVNFEQKQKQTIREYRLDRMLQLLEFYDNPHNKLRIVHIAGSKGKGSTALYIARGLEALGFKTGLYSSPHIADYRERITRAGKFFDENDYVEVGNRIKQDIPLFQRKKTAGNAEPTAFELFTLYAFLLFEHTDCEYAVIETGIGGRLDATNVVHPQATAITPIELEHTDILGSTLEQIASEKAGIIKPGVPVFVSPQKKAALKVLRRYAEKKSSTFYYVPECLPDFSAHVDSHGTRVQFTLPTENPTENPTESQNFLDLKDGFQKTTQENQVVTLNLAMQGLVQAENVVLALMVLRELQPRLFYSKVQKKLLQEIGGAVLPGRMEKCGTHPPVVFDGAHTPASIRRTVDTFQRIYGTRGICIFGSVEGKDTEGMAAALAGSFSDLIISRPGTFKPSSPEEVAQVFRRSAPSTELIINPKAALTRALQISENVRPVLVTGSFYMVAEIRPLLLKKIEREDV